MCRGYRNGNKALRCLCRHTREKPERTPQRVRLSDPYLGELALAPEIERLIALRRLPRNVLSVTAEGVHVSG